MRNIDCLADLKAAPGAQSRSIKYDQVTPLFSQDLLRIGGLLFGDPVAISDGAGGTMRLPGLGAWLNGICPMQHLQRKKLDVTFPKLG